MDESNREKNERGTGGARGGQWQQYSWEETLVQLKRLHHEWCLWEDMFKLASVFGILVDVDWQYMFQGIYDIVKIKIWCRDKLKILQLNFMILWVDCIRSRSPLKAWTRW